MNFLDPDFASKRRPAVSVGVGDWRWRGCRLLPAAFASVYFRGGYSFLFLLFFFFFSFSCSFSSLFPFKYLPFRKGHRYRCPAIRRPDDARRTTPKSRPLHPQFAQPIHIPLILLVSPVVPQFTDSLGRPSADIDKAVSARTASCRSPVAFASRRLRCMTHPLVDVCCISHTVASLSYRIPTSLLS